MSDTPSKDDLDKLPWLGRKLSIFDDMKNVDRLVHGLYGVCALLFLADFMYKKKTYMDLEDVPGFYALYGFFMCAALVICARAMRRLLMRPEDYYAPKDTDSEAYPEDGLSREEHDV